MRISDLRRRVAIQQRGGSIDTWGQQSVSWSDVLTNVPACIEPLSGRELVAAQAINPEVNNRITVRYHASLANPAAVAGMRVVYVNAGVTRYYNILAAMNIDERNRWIDLAASESVTQGA